MNILLVEDEYDLVRTLEDMLAARGYRVVSCHTGEDGVEQLNNGKFDLIILDVMLPGANGFQICYQIRRAGVQTPILMLTARDEVDSKVIGLNSGADDYLTKPFHPLEFQARVDALMRRRPQLDQTISTYEFRGALFDLKDRRMIRDHVVTELTQRECHLLRYLIERRSEIVSREDLLKDVWGYPRPIFTRTVDVHIVRLRHKIEKFPREPRFIITVHGRGYSFGG